MDKERKQDLGGPDEEALEQRVHDMLDITASDKSVTVPEKPSAPLKATKTSGKSVKVSFDEEEKPSVAEKKPDPELSAAIEATNAALSGQTVGTAPLIEKTAKPAANKKVVVTHFDDETPAAIESEQSAPELDELPEDLDPIEEPEEPAIELGEQVKTPEEPEKPKPITIGDLMATTSPLESEIESPETEKAVSDIVAAESDELLAVQDMHGPATTDSLSKNKGKKHPNLFFLILRSPAFRWFLLLLVIGALVGLGAFPKSRYYLLNKAGVKSTASITVMDKSTLRPLKNVKVSLAGQSATSDENGKATLNQLPLGPTELVIEKRAFATYKKPTTVGWGSNPLEDVSLSPQGDQYVFQINDVLSGKPIKDVEASVGELTATANDKGEITLTLDKIETETVTVTFKAAGYRDTTHELKLSNKQPVTVAMTLSKQTVFISKRTGKYDLYKIDADGKNESLVLKGTGSESADIILLPSPTDDVALLIATRDGTYSKDGKLLDNLVFVNLKDGSVKTVVSSTQLRAIDWIGSRLVYVMLNDDAGADDPARYKLMSYDYKSGDNRQLATTNYFNSVVSAGGKVYYAPAGAYQNGINLGVFSVHADGSGKQAILNQESWNMVRTAYDNITIASEQDWYSYQPGADKPVKIAGQPSDITPRVYSDSIDSKHSAWVDVRDGKGVIIIYDTEKKTEAVLLTQSGMTGPVRWLNHNTVVFRIATSRETADYVMSIDGGIAKKISDVTNTAGIDRWSY